MCQTPIFPLLPITAQFPFQALCPCMGKAASPSPDCPEGDIYTSAEHLNLPINVRQPNISSYSFPYHFPYLSSNSSSYPFPFTPYLLPFPY